MSIVKDEIEPDKKIVISKVQFSCDMIDESIPKPLFQNYNSFLILSAPPRSGKSTWIQNCLCRQHRISEKFNRVYGPYNKKFDKIYIVSPSLKTAKKDPFKCLPEDQIEQELTVDFLHRFEEEIKGSGLRVLLILDDVVNDIRKNKGVDKVLAKILYNRRHITADGGDEANGVTVWLTTQSWNRIPLMHRKVANGLIAFKLKNMKEILSIYDEFVIGLSKEQFLAILKYVYKDPYDFLFMNMDNNYDDMYYRNFNKLVLNV
eukprot:SAG11_NODE_1296_length_5271_cov_7.677688_2_plen_261_part_00